MIDRQTMVRLAREAVNGGDGSELSGDAIERFAQLVLLEAAGAEEVPPFNPSTDDPHVEGDKYNSRGVNTRNGVPRTADGVMPSDADRRDAARYRWLREQFPDSPYFIAAGTGEPWDCEGSFGAFADSAIDAARAGLVRAGRLRCR